MLTLMAALRVLLATLLSSAPVAIESGLAAVYGYPGDHLTGGPLACTGKVLRPTDRVCAHRTLPCGTTLVIQSLRSRRIATCQVLDRGPYGARLPSGRFVIKTHSQERGTWRGVVDLSPAVARMLGVHTSEPVRLFYMPSHSTKASASKKKQACSHAFQRGYKRACTTGPHSPRVNKHAAHYRSSHRRQNLEQPLVSTRSTRRSGRAGVFAESTGPAAFGNPWCQSYTTVLAESYSS